MRNVIGWIIGIVVVYYVFSSISGTQEYEGRSAEEWFNEYDESSAQVEELRTVLEEANSNIEEANYRIEAAKSYAGDSYGDMEDALYSLETVDTVDEP